MKTTRVDATSWQDANQRRLVGEIARVKTLLQPQTSEVPEVSGASIAQVSGGDFTVTRVQSAFGLSDFERDVLLLCAGCALDASVAALCARLAGDAAASYPTFALSLAVLPGGHWSALAPAGPLRHWSLIELGSSDVVTAAPLCIDERVLHHLVGVDYLDERLALHVQAPGIPAPLAAALELAERLLAGRTEGRPLAVQLIGAEPMSQLGVAAAVGQIAGAPLYVLPAESVPSAPAERMAFVRLWDREAALTGALLFVPCDDANSPDARLLLDAIQGPVILAAREPVRTSAAATIVDVTPPRWRDHGANGRDLLAKSPSGDALSALSQRIVPLATWEDLVLPPAQVALLHQMAGQVRRAEQVYVEWGLANKSHRGLGISALFSGPSGTGKTMAAEVLANELGRPLYRIDLSAVVSKYIGETEKNLRQVFDAAERSGDILLFDEADALFGRRSEVKDSHDRYANMEVSYLLQRMEAYSGLAILTTNFRSALDPAFVRRIRFIVDFPFPDAAGRAEIWSKVFPQAMPRDGIDLMRLSRLAIPGGSIRNIAVNAAFLAADDAAVVGMGHLLQAARAEYAKLERPQGEIDLVSRA